MKKYFVLLTITFLSTFLYAQNPSKVKEERSQREFIYYDGNTPKRVFLQEDLIAEIEGSNYASRFRASIKEEKNYGKIKIYKIKNPKIQQNIRSGGYTKSLSKQYKLSEVFRGEGGSLMFLPGGVIVRFKEGIDESTIQEFFKNKNLSVKRVQTINERNYYLVSTPPGLASLEIANQLSTEPIIDYSTPDWWIEAQKK
ncbi:MAG: hypothetical protein NZ853_09425 [Leptospiraceae bacterium]|nr:hypothetical protein [Leptospiraceae bacterium]MDW7975650.1 hypothetical protein [Leptospiraceae bacterium]